MLTLKNIRAVISAASDVRELRDVPQVLLDLDPVDVYVGALCATLDAERESLETRGAHLIYDRQVFAGLLRQQAIDLEELPVAAGPLTKAIGDQVAALVLDERFLSGVDLGADVDLGWARQMVAGAHRRYEDEIYALLPLDHGEGQDASVAILVARSVGQPGEEAARALETEERVGDLHGMAQTYHNLGNVHRLKGEWDRAIEFYQQSLEVKERVDDIHGMAQTYNNLGLVYADKGEWDRAIEFYQQSLETMERVGDIHGMAQTYNNLGIVYRRKGEWDRAIEFYQKDLEISERVGDIHGMATTWGNLGSLYQAQGEAELAAQYVARALLVFFRLGAQAEAQQAGSHLARILGSPEAAQAYLERMIEEEE